MRRIFIVAALLPVPAALLFGACGGNTVADESSADGGVAFTDSPTPDRARLPAPLHPDASCAVTIDTPVLLDSPHVAIGTPVMYDSNPPSSGPHYPIWAAFQEFMTPVDRRYYVHDLEHGAIVLLYKCDDAAGCPDVVQGFRDIIASLPNDPICDPTMGEPRVRMVITPDPLIPTTVAASAWGWTYTADCFDLPTLKDFVLAHYGQRTELLCAQGQTQF